MCVNLCMCVCFKSILYKHGHRTILIIEIVFGVQSCRKTGKCRLGLIARWTWQGEQIMLDKGWEIDLHWSILAIRPT